MTELRDGRQGNDSMWRWWPCFVSGFCAPLLAHVLQSWLSPSLAVGGSFFIMWLIVGLIFTFSPPSRNWKLTSWAGAGAVGAIVAGLIAAAVHS